MVISEKSPATSFLASGSLIFVLSLFLVSCAASVSVKPEVPVSNNIKPIIVSGSIVYDGNPDYLPATVNHESGTDITIKYAYIVSYGGTGNAEILTAFLPTTFIGTPTGNDDVIAIGKLELSKDSKLVKSYVSEVTVSKPRGIFLGGVDKTELRRMALKRLKENIEIQMNNDNSLLAQINY
jgi:hypothetical protein